MKIYFLDNKIIGANIIDYSSEKLPYYPASNIKTSSTKSKWRTDGLHDPYDWISFDLGQAKPMEYFQALGSNISDGATCLVDGADDDDFSIELISQELSGKELKEGKFLTKITKRYFRIVVDDASNPDGYIEIGKLNAAEKKTFAQHVVTQFASKQDDKSLVTETENLVVFSVRKELLQHVAFTLQQLTTTDKQMLESFISNYGLTRSFAVYIEDESQGNYTLPNMKFSGMPQIETVAYNNYSVKIDLVEEV
jgi:hypothetical protein